MLLLLFTEDDTAVDLHVTLVQVVDELFDLEQRVDITVDQVGQVECQVIDEQAVVFIVALLDRVGLDEAVDGGQQARPG